MSATWVLLFFCRDGSLPFMTRLPKKRGITQVEEDKSLILRQSSLEQRSLIGEQQRAKI